VIGAALFGVTGTAVHAQSKDRTVSQADWNKILTDAKKEGLVVVYTTTAPAVHERIKADFEKAYPGIKMDAVRVIGNLINTRVEQERAAGNIEGDAIITSELVWSAAAAKKGWLRVPVGPNAQAWPESGMRQGAVPLIGVNPFVMVYNTNLVKTPRFLLRFGYGVGYPLAIHHTLGYGLVREFAKSWHGRFQVNFTRIPCNPFLCAHGKRAPRR
jgi:ABC-type glycerol-3-phosphate transport system substrate-binding protein